MSTKIYNAFKNTEVITLADLSNLLSGFRSNIREQQQAALYSLLATKATNAYDLHTIGLINYSKILKGQSYLSWAFSNITEQINETRQSGIRHPEVDYDLEISCISHNNMAFFILYTEQSDFIEKFASLDGMQDWGWWNNTDKPDNISKEDWLERETDWKEIFKNNALPSEIGYLISEKPNFKRAIKPVSVNLPTFQKRLEFCAKEIARTAALGLLKENDSENYLDWIEKKNSLEYKSAYKTAYNDAIISCKKIINQKIDIEDLKKVPE